MGNKYNVMMNLNVVNTKSHKIDNCDKFSENRYFRCCCQKGCNNLTVKGQPNCTKHNNLEYDINTPQNVYYMNNNAVRKAYNNISVYVNGYGEIDNSDIDTIAEFTERSPQIIWDYICDRIKENKEKYSNVDVLDKAINNSRFSSNKVHKSITDVYNDIINQNKQQECFKNNVKQFVDQIVSKIEQEYSNVNSIRYSGSYPSNNVIEKEMIRDYLRNLGWCVCKSDVCSNSLNINFWRDDEWK